MAHEFFNGREDLCEKIFRVLLVAFESNAEHVSSVITQEDNATSRKELLTQNF